MAEQYESRSRIDLTGLQKRILVDLVAAELNKPGLYRTPRGRTISQILRRIEKGTYLVPKVSARKLRQIDEDNPLGEP